MVATCVGFALGFAFLTCTSPDVSVDAARFCRTAEPIRWSKRDTAETVRQAKIHNAKGVAICNWGRP